MNKVYSDAASALSGIGWHWQRLSDHRGRWFSSVRHLGGADSGSAQL